MDSARSVEAADLAAALRGGQIEVRYQPIVSVPDGRLLSAEALAHWSHPAHGAINEGVLMALAESSGQVVDLTRFVAREAIRQVAAWGREAGGAAAPAEVAINISPHAQWLEGFVDLLETWAMIDGVAPGQLTLELAGTAIRDNGRLLSFLARARQRGFHVAVDDFGGRGGLGKARRVPFSTVKVGHALIRPLHGDAEARAVLEARLRHGKELGLRTVAECVQSADDWHLVHELGCDAAQGTWIAPPLGAQEVTQWAAMWAASLTVAGFSSPSVARQGRT